MMRYTIMQNKETKYAFVDGAYIDCVIDSYAKIISPESLVDYEVWPIINGYDKTFYYHCLPSKKDGEYSSDYDKRVNIANDRFNFLKTLPGFHVFQGKTKLNRGRIIQKGVDVQLAVHMLTFVNRGVVRDCTLFAGDSDFVPLVEALVMEGANVTVRGQRPSTAKALADAADKFMPLRFFDQIKSCFSKVADSLRQPGVVSSGELPEPASESIVCRGRLRGEDAIIFKEEGHFGLIHVGNRGGLERYVGESPTLLKLAAEDRDFIIDWQS